MADQNPQAESTQRCERCGWSIVPEGHMGCWASNCSQRPLPPVQNKETAPRDLPRMLSNIVGPADASRNQRLADAQAENASLKAIAIHLHWMARRYVDGRQSYATSLHNENTRELLAMGVPLNATGDGTLWARDAGGRGL